MENAGSGLSLMHAHTHMYTLNLDIIWYTSILENLGYDMGAIYL